MRHLKIFLQIKSLFDVYLNKFITLNKKMGQASIYLNAVCVFVLYNSIPLTFFSELTIY